MTEIEKAAIAFIDVDDETIDCMNCQKAPDDYICVDHKDRHQSALQTLRRLTREKQGSKT